MYATPRSGACDKVTAEDDLRALRLDAGRQWRVRGYTRPKAEGLDLTIRRLFVRVIEIGLSSSPNPSEFRVRRSTLLPSCARGFPSCLRRYAN
jgi:hypothetical protein